MSGAERTPLGPAAATSPTDSGATRRGCATNRARSCWMANENLRSALARSLPFASRWGGLAGFRQNSTHWTSPDGKTTDLRTPSCAPDQDGAPARAPHRTAGSPADRRDAQGHQGLSGRTRRPGARQPPRRPRRIRLPRRADRLRQDHADQDADSRASAHRGRGADRGPRHLLARRQEGAAASPADRHRLPGLQASAEPQRLRQRRLRPAGDRRVALGVRRKVPDALRLVGLADKVKNFPDQLSGGEQQRLSVARAFVNHPPLLLADEPTGNLDPNTSIGIMQVLYRINRTGTTVVVVTHDREMVDKMRRRVIALEYGRRRPRPGRGHLHRRRRVDARVRRAAARRDGRRRREAGY